MGYPFFTHSKCSLQVPADVRGVGGGGQVERRASLSAARVHPHQLARGGAQPVPRVGRAAVGDAGCQRQQVHDDHEEPTDRRLVGRAASGACTQP